MAVSDRLKDFTFVKTLFLKLIHVKLGLLYRINEFMQNSFLFVGLFLSYIALSDKVVVLGLVFKVIEIHLLIGLFVVFFKKHHIFLQVIFVFGHVFQNLFLVLSRVKDFELYFFLFLCGINLTDRGLDDGLKFAFNKELLIN